MEISRLIKFAILFATSLAIGFVTLLMQDAPAIEETKFTGPAPITFDLITWFVIIFLILIIVLPIIVRNYTNKNRDKNG
jgi:preprotein translocase subunit SecG